MKKEEFLKRRVNLKAAIIILTISIALILPLSEYLTGNALIKTWGGTDAPGKMDYTSKLYVNKGHYTSTAQESQCTKGGGVSLILKKEQIINNVPVEVHSINEDIVLISVNGAKRVMEYGWEKYVAGFYVTVFSTGTNDACLIIK